MRNFLAFIFIVITIVSVSRPVNTSCDESSPKNSISFDKQVSLVSVDSPCQDDDHANSGHKHEACHNCHLGHCSFTIGSNVSLVSNFEIPGFVPVNHSFSLYDYKTSPFRPPIS